MNKKRLVFGITGASGSIYAKRFLQFLVTLPVEIYLIISPAGRQVINHELGLDIPSSDKRSREFLVSLLGSDKAIDKIQYLKHMDFFSPVASGSFLSDSMVICPCSMGTIARIRHGVSGNLMERTADVMIKERRPLVLLARETPVSSLHLENMLALSKMGVRIMPASPGFYNHPKSIEDIVDFIVGKLADQLGFQNSISARWSEI